MLGVFVQHTQYINNTNSMRDTIHNTMHIWSSKVSLLPNPPAMEVEFETSAYENPSQHQVTMRRVHSPSWIC